VLAIVRTASLLGSIALLCACTVSSGPPAASVGATPTASPERSAAPTVSSGPSPTATPRPDPPVAASEPDALVVQIVAAEHAVRDSGVTRLAARPEWRDTVLAALPSDIRATATANADATADLRATVVPGPDLPKTWRIVDPAPLDDLARYYRDAEVEFGIPWSYLAAIHLVETRMGRIRGTSVAGAQGPMQFMPATWARYGEGDINSDRDAIRAAARYLQANGAPANMAGALFRYNQSQRYVRAVTAYAEVMRGDPDAYRGYYGWQVYYLTTSGDVLLPVGYGR